KPPNRQKESKDLSISASSSCSPGSSRHDYRIRGRSKLQPKASLTLNNSLTFDHFINASKLPRTPDAYRSNLLDGILSRSNNAAVPRPIGVEELSARL